MAVTVFVFDVEPEDEAEGHDEARQYNAYIADQQNELREYLRRSKVHPNLR